MSKTICPKGMKGFVPGPDIPFLQVLHDMAAAGERARTHDSKVAGAPDMLPEARRILEDFYAPWNHRLSSLLRDRRFKWAAPA